MHTYSIYVHAQVYVCVCTQMSMCLMNKMQK